mmetsp:Transcript_61880/g.144961  ORF Transcript_61880/g.144961 Transcript_61880/m.144961 type:complete len:242 (+) Transcript_61880:657-1382(+)
MSTSMRFLSRSWRSSGLMMGTLLPVAVKVTSLWRITSNIFSNGTTSAFDPPRFLTNSSSSTSWAFSTERFTRLTLMSGYLLKSANSSNLDILPAPMMHTCSLLAGFRRSCIALDIMSSTAALDTDTEPLPIFVRVRTILPIRIAALSIRETIFPPHPAIVSSSAFWMACSWQALTCERICASPRTRESRPELTSNRCCVAASPLWLKRYGSSSSRGIPDFWLKKARTASTAANFLISGEAK